jgi:glycosyltransferase involved in cell wall biosynthesis
MRVTSPAPAAAASGSGGPARIGIASCGFDRGLGDVDGLLARYHAMTGWARALADAGAVVTVFQRFERDAIVRREGVEYRLLADRAEPQPRPWFWASRLVGEVTRFRPTAVHVDGLLFPAVVRHLRLRLPAATAIVVQDHGGFGARARAFTHRAVRTFYRWGLGAADGFLFTVREQAAPWRLAGIIGPGHRVHEIPEASTDLGDLATVGRPSERLPGRPALLWVGRLDANKDPLTVLEGLAQASVSLPDAALTMVFGEDGLLPAVEARLARDSSLAARVHLRGRVERRELGALYAAADLFVLGSHREVACFSLIEALSFGLAPVVTDIPPFRTLTGGGQFGALFPPGDAQGLSGALVRLCRGGLPDRRSVRAHFERELGWPALGRRALEIYQSCSAGRAS